MKFESKDEITRVETILALVKSCTYPELKGNIIFKLVESIEWLNTERKAGIKSFEEKELVTEKKPSKNKKTKKKVEGK